MDAVSFAKKNPGSTIRAGSLVSMPQKELLGVPQSAKQLTNLVIKNYNNIFPESPLSSLKYVKGAPQVQNPILKPASSTTGYYYFKNYILKCTSSYMLNSKKFITVLIISKYSLIALSLQWPKRPLLSRQVHQRSSGEGTLSSFGMLKRH